jgi:hypothetical protein
MTKSVQVHGKHTHRNKTNDSRKRNEITQLHNYDERYCNLTENYLLCRTRTRVGKTLPGNLFCIFRKQGNLLNF